MARKQPSTTEDAVRARRRRAAETTEAREARLAAQRKRTAANQRLRKLARNDEAYVNEPDAEYVLRAAERDAAKALPSSRRPHATPMLAAHYKVQARWARGQYRVLLFMLQGGAGRGYCVCVEVKDHPYWEPVRVVLRDHADRYKAVAQRYAMAAEYHDRAGCYVTVREQRRAADLWAEQEEKAHLARMAQYRNKIERLKNGVDDEPPTEAAA